MAFVRRHRVTVVLLPVPGVVVTLVVLRLREQQARAVPRLRVPALYAILEERFPRRLVPEEGAGA
jgi:hypothetical protein